MEAVPLVVTSKGIKIKDRMSFKIKLSSGNFVIFHLWFCLDDAWKKDSLLSWHASFWDS